VDLEAIVELWFISDENYPHLTVGMKVNLSFEMAMTHVLPSAETSLVHLGNAEYRFAGEVIQRYEEPEPIVVIESGGFRFFSEGALAAPLRVGDHIAGDGTLIVDYYGWAELIDERVDAPNIFVNLEIRRIRRIEIPVARTQTRGDRQSYPVRTKIAECDRIVDVLSTADHDSNAVFFLLDLAPIADNVPRTFIYD
jgi:hypothetical protein